MEITMEINTLLNILVIVVIVPFGFFIKRLVNDFDETRKLNIEYQKQTTHEVNEVKLNYLSRFEALTQKVNDLKNELTHSINESEKNLTKLITDRDH